ncbi:MAG: hypothetical protein IPK32_00135 [Verrucomicrobiaceae bacterium]|nr:hypothetical protein [Verrucomicrobiaceae bacterium]
MSIPRILFSFILLSAVSAPSYAQQRGRQREQQPEALALPVVPLTPQQIEVITKQLVDVEKQILEMRNSSLTSIMAKLRSAVASEAAALNFHLDCEKLVNIERKDLAKTEERDRKEQMERQAERRKDGNEEDQGDLGAAAKLQIEYLLLTLEAHETKAEDRTKLLPKLQAYIQKVVASADKLKGRAGQTLGRDLGGSVIVDALQIRRFVSADGWTTNPLNLGAMWNDTILPIYLADGRKEELSAQWDARLSAETILNKARMPEPEFMIWGQQELPPMKWQRAKYLVANGPSPVNALADMLNHIKAYPGHPDAPQWLEELRSAVGAAAPSGGAPATPTGTGG